jgi:hypothetical protein
MALKNWFGGKPTGAIFDEKQNAWEEQLGQKSGQGSFDVGGVHPDHPLANIIQQLVTHAQATPVTSSSNASTVPLAADISFAGQTPGANASVQSVEGATGDAGGAGPGGGSGAGAGAGSGAAMRRGGKVLGYKAGGKLTDEDARDVHGRPDHRAARRAGRQGGFDITGPRR